MLCTATFLTVSSLKNAQLEVIHHAAAPRVRPRPPFLANPQTFFLFIFFFTPLVVWLVCARCFVLMLLLWKRRTNSSHFVWAEFIYSCSISSPGLFFFFCASFFHCAPAVMSVRAGLICFPGVGTRRGGRRGGGGEAVFFTLKDVGPVTNTVFLIVRLKGCPPPPKQTNL